MWTGNGSLGGVPGAYATMIVTKGPKPQSLKGRHVPCTKILVERVREEAEVRSCTVCGKMQRKGRGRRATGEGHGVKKGRREGQCQRREDAWHARVGSLITRLCKTVGGAFVGVHSQSQHLGRRELKQD